MCEIKFLLNRKKSLFLLNWLQSLTLRGNKLQGLFVPFARLGSSDPVRVLRLFHNKYSGYCCIRLLCKAMYNLSLPRLSANYYGLPMTVQLWAAHESRCSLFGVSQSTAQVLYCTCLERYIFGTVQSRKKKEFTSHWITSEKNFATVKKKLNKRLQERIK